MQHKYLILFILLFLIGAVFAQNPPTALIEVVAYSPQELEEMGWHTPPSSGLTNVGNGTLVYLKGMEKSGQEITAYTWSITSQPNGSTATLDSTDTPQTTFRPDLVGEYIIQLSITTTNGVDDTTVTIHSAEYVGVGIIDTLEVTPTKAECSPCHTPKVEAWTLSGHSGMLREQLNENPTGYYNENCISCHTVGWDTTAVNNGFDDVATTLSWVFPVDGQGKVIPGSWDSMLVNYPELAKLGNIQCENCHGPASEHKKSFNPKLMDVSMDEGLCGTCHEEAPYHRKNIQWKNSAHASGEIAFAANREECAGCHSALGFTNRIDPDKPFEGNAVGEPFISCQVCHDPHGNDLPHQIRTLSDVTLMNGQVVTFGGNGKICMQCHMSRRDAESYATSWKPYFGPHYGPQTDMLAGTNAITFGLDIPSSGHKDVVENSCATCHMAETPGVGQPGRDEVGEHTFAMDWDGGTPDDPSDDVDNVTACQQCHGPITSFEDIKAKFDYDGDGVKEAAQEEVQGLLDQVAMLLPPIGSTDVAILTNRTTDPNYTPLQLKAAYNYLFVKDDKSMGVHNFQYAVGLLRATYKALTAGDIGAGTITSITDVPNDQGKQVRITWTRFGADGISDNPIRYYAIWRLSENGVANAKNNVNLLNSLKDLPSDISSISENTQLKMDGQLWDFAGSVPAAGFEEYSAIAPTLFDSTIVDGMHWSVFFVSGHTAIPSVYVASAPDSGYSVDNLVPGAPTGVTANMTDTGVQLTWEEIPDEDFNYYAIYRSTSSGFDPGTMEPLATTTETQYLDTDVQDGITYYYVVTAYDFSGNQGEFSTEVPVQVTAIGETNDTNIPGTFVLDQNYPNPFNPSTRIRFGLPRQAEIQVVIYNILGEPIRTIAQGKFSAGYHEINWDGRDNQGRTVSAGIYIYRLEGDDVHIAKKMILMK